MNTRHQCERCGIELEDGNDLSFGDYLYLCQSCHKMLLDQQREAQSRGASGLKVGYQTNQTLQEGSQFQMGRITCTITKVTSFSGEPHYGFTYHHDDGRLGCGFMPVLFVENFTGHVA